MINKICVSAVGKLITALFLAADIALGIWIFKSYREVHDIVIDEPTALAYELDYSSGQNGAGRPP